MYGPTDKIGRRVQTNTKFIDQKTEKIEEIRLLTWQFETE